jgi:hypothetical protein
MANVDFGRFKRMVQYIWDPEPTNNDASSAPVWCLGKQYKLSPAGERPAESIAQEDSGILVESPPNTQTATPPDSVAGSLDSALAYDDGRDGGWPPPFLDDFEARIWLTYRSNFPAIPKSQDPKALSSMSLAVRLRSLGEQGGFTSDTGWGCMIRSGQSLLANAFLNLKLGRGKMESLIWGVLAADRSQIGVGVLGVSTKSTSYHFLQMIQKLLIRSINSWNMELLLVENILGSGLALRLLLDVYSKETLSSTI